MVLPTEAQFSTRIQTTLAAHETKIDELSDQMKELTSSVSAMQNLIAEIPKSVEKMLQNVQLKSPESTVHNSGDLFSIKHSDDSLFSLPKVKLPAFEGTDARGWVSKAELYFQLHKTPEDQKLCLSQMCMDGSALHWFTNLLIRHPDTTWDQFRLKLLNRFSGTKYRNAHEALGSLFQENSVEEYIEDFEALSALIPNQTEEQSIGWFLRGLNDEIKNWVRTLNPSTCDAAMEFSCNVEAAMGVPHLMSSSSFYEQCQSDKMQVLYHL